MRNWLKNHTFLTLGIMATPLALIAGFVSAGFGHGDYVVARVVLPFACVFVGMYFGAGIIVTLWAFAQWPLYGFLIDRTTNKLRGMASVFVIHASLCWWLFTKGSHHF